MPPKRQTVRQASLPHRKLNLAHKRRVSSNKVWLIGKHQRSQIFYLAVFDDSQNTALWSRHEKDGMTFKTEVGVNKYITSHLNSRTDIILIKMEQ